MGTKKRLEPLVIEALAVIRELWSGEETAAAAAELDLLSFDGRPEAALEDLVLALAVHLGDAPAAKLAAYGLPEGTELREIDVDLPLPDMPAGVAKTLPLSLPCLVMPAPPSTWVVVIPLQHTLHVDAGQDVEVRTRAEIERIVAARELGLPALRRLFPARVHRLETIRVEVDREERGTSADLVSSRKQAATTRRRNAARRTLGEVALPFDSVVRRVKPSQLRGRDQAVKALEALTSGDTRLSTVVIGEPLVGKSALIATVLDGRANVCATSGAQLLAGQSGFGQWQERLHAVMKAAETLDAILYFDDLGDLFAGRGGFEDMAGLMRRYIAERRVRIVGELHSDKVQLAEARHLGFFRSLHPLRLDPLDAATTERIVIDRIGHLTQTQPNQPVLTPEAAPILVDLCERYLVYQALPGKALNVLAELSARHEADVRDAQGRRLLGEGELHEAFSATTGIPTFLLRQDQALKLDDLVKRFGSRVIGQEAATRRLAEVVCTIKARLQPAGKPLATFLFAGPTGVGKTEVARTLAEVLFGARDRLLRFDMSEFADPLAAERLIRGSDRDEGLLTRRIRRQPFAVVLLDEIEKAHPAVFDLLLQVCGEGRLTDARGQTAYFHNAIITLTSNLGAASRRTSAGFVDSAEAGGNQRYYEEQVAKHFRPELVNRLDRVVAFEALTPDEIAAIAKLAVHNLASRAGLVDRSIALTVSDAALAQLARGGYSAELGARQLRRHLDTTLVAPLAGLISATAHEVANGRAEVSLSSEAQTGAAPLAERLDGDGLRIAIHRGVRRNTRARIQSLGDLAETRRWVRRRMQGERVSELGERVSYLAKQVFDPKLNKKRRSDRRLARELGEMQAEHHRLDAILTALQGPLEELTTAEELAILAVLEEESPQPFLVEATGARDRFEAKLPYALVALEPRRDAITLRVVERDRGRGLDLWLQGLLDHAPERGWEVTTHLRPWTPEPTVSWPATLDFGPPRTPLQIKDALVARRTGGGSRGGDQGPVYQAIVRVKGPYAGAFLALEAGLHRWLEAPNSEESTTHLEIDRVAFRAAVGAADWTLNAYKPAAPPTSRLSSHTPTRGYHFGTRELSVLDPKATRVLPHDRYWPELDQTVARDLLLYEDDPALDRAVGVFRSMLDVTLGLSL